MMDLSIVILHHGSPHEVTRNLTALKAAWLPEKTEVFVVNNGREGANAEIPFEKNLKFDLRFYEIPNKGYPNGNNFGFKMAKGKFLCILNPDVRVEKNTFKVLLDYLKEHKKVGIVAPRLQYPSGTYQDNYRNYPRLFDLIVKRTGWLRNLFGKRMRRYLMWDKDVQESEAVDWLTGAFQILTRKCWDLVGPNEELYFLFMSDVDICRTAWERGFEVHFVGDTQAGHNEGRLSAGGFSKIFKSKVMRIHIVDAFKYYWKWKLKRLPKRSPSASRYG
ncbi:glycosyltransferase family 2 protein [Candidatus Peregrinibacteria bacterium]|nr:glycosyltransferase family 2 protein [Candidatus Peregrinibacteria bacterium]